MVTGDFAVPRNDELGPSGLRNIAPYLDLAETFGADLIRICMKKEEDIAWAQRASDTAAERGIRLAHQSHCSSLFETVEGSLRVLETVDRPNFGIIYEPANWMIAGEDYGRETIKRLGPHLFNVYVQNHRLNPQGEGVVQTWNRGPVRLDHIGLWESGGIDFDEVFQGLADVQYRGYVTIHQAFAGIMSVSEAARRSATLPRAVDGVKRGPAASSSCGTVSVSTPILGLGRRTCGTRLNPRPCCLLPSVAPRDLAWAAIRRSLWPMGWHEPFQFETKHAVVLVRRLQ